MTYRELAARLATLSPEQLDAQVTYWDSVTDEYHALTHLDVAQVTDVLDASHPYLTAASAWQPA
jgi:GTP cyclohydrolase III